MVCGKMLWCVCSCFMCPEASSLGALSGWLTLGSLWYPPIFFFHFPLSASSCSGTTKDAHLVEQSLFLQAVWSLVLKEWCWETKMWVQAASRSRRFSLLLGLPVHRPVWIPVASCEGLWRIKITSHFQPSHWGGLPVPLISQSSPLKRSWYLKRSLFLLPSACFEEQPFLVYSSCLGSNENMDVWFPRVAIAYDVRTPGPFHISSGPLCS